MRIVDKRPSAKATYFYELHPGDVFYHQEDKSMMMMKIYPITNEDEDTYNAVNLITGELDSFCGGDEVIIADAELTVLT